MLVWVFLTCACSQAHTPHCKYTCIVNVVPMKSCPTLKYLTALDAGAHVCTPKLWRLIVHSVVLVCVCLHHRVLMFHTAPAWRTATFLLLLPRYACKCDEHACVALCSLCILHSHKAHGDSHDWSYCVKCMIWLTLYEWQFVAVKIILVSPE